MPRKAFSTDRVIKLPAPLSYAVQSGNLLFLSGVTGFATDGGIAEGDFAAQMHQVMESITFILEDAGSSLDRVVKVNAYLARVEDGREMFAIYRTYFDEPYPALTTVGASFVREQFLLEIDCVAEV